MRAVRRTGKPVNDFPGSVFQNTQLAFCSCDFRTCIIRLLEGSDDLFVIDRCLHIFAIMADCERYISIRELVSARSLDLP